MVGFEVEERAGGPSFVIWRENEQIWVAGGAKGSGSGCGWLLKGPVFRSKMAKIS
jgi:hypothetical protein